MPRLVPFLMHSCLVLCGLWILTGSSRQAQAAEFALVPDRETTTIDWSVDIDGKPHRGQLTRLDGGLHLDEARGVSSGQLSANLRYLFTGKPMWDMWLTELLFEVVRPGFQDLVVELESLTSTASSKDDRGSALAKLVLGFRRGAFEREVPVLMEWSSQGLHVRSTSTTTIDLAETGYGQRLAELQKRIGVKQLGSVISFRFDLRFQSPAPPPPEAEPGQ